MENSTEYNIGFKNFIDKLDKTDLEKYLKNAQIITRQIFNYNPTQKGFLVFHETGYGKTLTAISIIDEMRKTKLKIIFLSSKSLKTNIENGISQYSKIANIDEENFKKIFNFVSLNSSNMFDQVQKTNDDYELFDNVNLDDTLILIDEAHNFFNSICNGSKNALSLYDGIMNSTAKVVFLTGTPVINDVFEIVPAMNMCRGFLNKRERITLFPENREEFHRLFVEEKDGEYIIKNKHILQNRMNGLISYYGRFNFEDDKIVDPDFPELLPNRIIKIEMSQYQYSFYENCRIAERKEKSFFLALKKRFTFQ